MDMRSHEMIERRRDDNGNINSIITNEDNDNNNNKTRVSCNSQTLDPHHSTVRYRECLKNYAANVGGSVYDGCGEFMPSGEEGTMEALRCAACDCHRNFHRKENDTTHHRHGGGGRRLMLPPPPMHHHHKYGGGMVTPMSVAYGAESSSGQSSGEQQMMFSKKRFRTKFTAEQKERMMEFAEKLGWRMNKQDEEELKRFCCEVGVKRQVFKVWMHNNKNNARKTSTTGTGTL